MSILVWEKPKPVRSKKEHAEISFDGGPPGGFVSNMSDDDYNSWRAKVVGLKTGYPQVEIRHSGAVIIVSYSGYKYKTYDTRPTEENIAKARRFDRDDDGSDWAKIHIACAGPIMLTLKEFNDMNAAIGEAFAYLKELGK